MWSIKDTQLDNILQSGRNSETKEQALEEAFNFWLFGTDLTKEEIEELREKKEEWLKNVGLVAFEHDKRID